MSSSLLIRGGTVVSADGVSIEDVRIHNGRVIEVGPDLRSETSPEFEADGLHLLPGVVDAHSHMWEPGLTSRPDFRDDTASAAVGGITTIIDHPLTPPEILTRQRFEEKARLGEATSHIDFALHAGLSPDTLEHLPEMAAAGATAFKFFTCDTGCAMQGFPTLDGQRNALRATASVGALALVHAEDQTILDANREALVARGEHPASAFLEWRTLDAELSAVRSVLELAKQEGAATYFVHCSAPEVVDVIAAARRTGVKTWAETCPHYLSLSADDIRRRGHWATTSPPVREVSQMREMRKRLGQAVSVIGSDHGSVAAERKAIDDAFQGQPGLPGNETMVALLLDLVSAQELALTTLVALTATNPASTFGLWPRKGALRPGFDGDVTIVDLNGSTTIDRATLHGATEWSPYEGWTLRGSVVATVVRGAIVAKDGALLSEPGYGQFYRRGHSE